MEAEKEDNPDEEGVSVSNAGAGEAEKASIRHGEEVESDIFLLHDGCWVEAGDMRREEGHYAQEAVGDEPPVESEKIYGAVTRSRH